MIFPETGRQSKREPFGPRAPVPETLLSWWSSTAVVIVPVPERAQYTKLGLFEKSGPLPHSVPPLGRSGLLPTPAGCSPASILAGIETTGCMSSGRFHFAPIRANPAEKGRKARGHDPKPTSSAPIMACFRTRGPNIARNPSCVPCSLLSAPQGRNTRRTNATARIMDPFVT